MNRPRLSRLPLWERHEARVLAILREALTLLAQRGLSGDEPMLNRELFFCLCEANRNALLRGEEAFDYPVVWEGRNPPLEDLPEGEASERKVPDFYWGYFDHSEPDPRRAARNFVIECKRLGSPTPAGWVFTKHYVEDGVIRFVDPEWRYGRAVATGAMVGYIQSMTTLSLLREVNVSLQRHGLAALTNARRARRPLDEMEHTLARTFPVSPYRIVHLWVCASRSPSSQRG
jgi:hypothetical protein